VNKSGLVYKANILKNLIAFKKLLIFLEINELDFYKDEIEYLRESEIYSTTEDSTSIFNDFVFELYTKSNYIVNSINSLKV
jgi:hypothetical protein